MRKLRHATARASRMNSSPTMTKKTYKAKAPALWTCWDDDLVERVGFEPTLR